MKRLYILIIALITLVSCTEQAKTKSVGEKTYDRKHISIEYAQNFSIDDSNPHMRLLTIQNTESKHAIKYLYTLIDDETMTDSVPDGYTAVKTPVENFICMTSLQLSNFIALDITDRVKGITSTRHLFNKKMNEQLKNGQTAQIGIEGNFDNEVIIAIDPQLILISPSKRGGYDVLAESGLPLMPHLGYQEPNPLGQAEWIKLIGILTGKEQEACNVFDDIANNYNLLKQEVQDHIGSDGIRPTIMSGDTKGGNWYATGGRSFLAQIFKDAGGQYFMEDNESTGGVNIDFETVYAQGADAEYWRVSNSFDGDFSYKELGKQDSRFKDFKAMQEHKVIYCNMAKTPFYESFPMHPDMILADFISIFHPEIIPEHKPVYYHLMK